MTRLEYVKNGYAKQGLDLGFITPTVYGHYEKYEIYSLALEQGNSHMESLDIAAKLTKSSRSTMRRALKFFGVKMRNYEKFHITGNNQGLKLTA